MRATIDIITQNTDSPEHANCERFIYTDINLNKKKNILESQLCMLKSVIEHSKIPITLHGVWMVKP